MFSPSTSNKILGTIRNQLNAAEGSLMPPPQRGAFRVPFVTALTVQQTTQFIGGTQFVLTFQEPSSPNAQIDHFNIFVGGLTGNQINYNGPNTCLASPAVVRVSTTEAQTITFKIQTVLASGLVSNIDASPTCTGTTIPAAIAPSDIPDGSLDIVKLASQTPGSLLEWNSAGDPALLAPVATGQLLTSTGTATPPVYRSLATLKISIPLFDHFADVGNVTTGETDLYSDTTVASQLGVNGDKLAAGYSGTIAASATATRDIRVYFGGTKIFDTGGNVNSTGGSWNVNVQIIRENGTTVRCNVWSTLTGPVTFSFDQYTRVTGLTLANTNILKITGQAGGSGAATNDIVASMGFVRWDSAA